MWVRADLHIHTCLSPCGDLEMSPMNIVRTAAERGLDIIAVTDHNSAENVEALIRAAYETPLKVIPGMEITSSEEVHILSLFDSLESSFMVQDRIQEGLGISTGEAHKLDQVLANEHDEVEGFCTKMLMGASSFSIRKIVNLIHDVNGLAIAAHIDRRAFGIIGQLGFIPPRTPFDGLEVSSNFPVRESKSRYPEYSKYPFVTSSDAHFLKDIGMASTLFRLNRPTFHDIAKAFNNQDGCSIETTDSRTHLIPGVLGGA